MRSALPLAALGLLLGACPAPPPVEPEAPAPAPAPEPDEPEHVARLVMIKSRAMTFELPDGEWLHQNVHVDLLVTLVDKATRERMSLVLTEHSILLDVTPAQRGRTEVTALLHPAIAERLFLGLGKAEFRAILRNPEDPGRSEEHSRAVAYGLSQNEPGQHEPVPAVRGEPPPGAYIDVLIPKGLRAIALPVPVPLPAARPGGVLDLLCRREGKGRPSAVSRPLPPLRILDVRPLSPDTGKALVLVSLEEAQYVTLAMQECLLEAVVRAPAEQRVE